MLTIRSLSTSQETGVTLIETMVALAILGVGLLALLGMQASAMRLSSANQDIQLARDTLVSVVEEIKTLTNLQLRTDTNVFPTDGTATLAGLPAQYQLTGIDQTLAADYDYQRWRGVTLETTNGASRDYVIKANIDRVYLLQDVLARGEATIFWQSQGVLSDRPVESFKITFFTERKP